MTCQICFISRNKDEITADRFSDASLVIFGGPREGFSKTELQELSNWLKNGGRILLCVNEGDEKRSGDHINSWLEQ